MKVERTGPPGQNRDASIAELRVRLGKLADGESSLCAIVGERGIFCRGFRQWNDHEFHRRWKAVFGSSTHLTRPEIERLADLWQLTEQLACGAGLPCDIRSVGPTACAGWREFTDTELDRFCTELRGKDQKVDGSSSDESASGGPIPVATR
jgi:hypothetical protein